MISESSIDQLQHHARKTGRSLLQYVNEAFPWTRDSKDEEIVRELGAMLLEEQACVVRIARFLRQQHTAVPPLGPYPAFFTTLNFLALERLLPLLAEDQAAAVAELQRSLLQVPEPAARELLQALLDVKQKHLTRLQELQAQESAPAAAS